MNQGFNTMKGSAPSMAHLQDAIVQVHEDVSRLQGSMPLQTQELHQEDRYAEIRDGQSPFRPSKKEAFLDLQDAIVQVQEDVSRLQGSMPVPMHSSWTNHGHQDIHDEDLGMDQAQYHRQQSGFSDTGNAFLVNMRPDEYAVEGSSERLNCSDVHSEMNQDQHLGQDAYQDPRYMEQEHVHRPIDYDEHHDKDQQLHSVHVDAEASPLQESRSRSDDQQEQEIFSERPCLAQTILHTEVYGFPQPVLLQLFDILPDSRY